MITIGQIEREIHYLGNHFNEEMSGKTNRECVDKLRELCPQLHSEKEIHDSAKKIIDEIKASYGFVGLRVWYRTYYHAIFPHDEISQKYFKLLEDINSYVVKFLQENDFSLKLDVYLLHVEIKDVFRKNYGYIDDVVLSDVYSFLRTIHLSDYDSHIINVLEKLLEFQLVLGGDKYYSALDLTDVDVLRELYVYVAEEYVCGDVFDDCFVSRTYDGYGGMVYDVSF